MMENCDDKIVTGDEVLELLKEDADQEEETIALLGASDDSSCSYPLGYVARQALYACTTCNAVNNEIAGICLACSLSCHEGHLLVELYTKRDFRCDCGNSKFTEKCKLYQDKDKINEKNAYNHNFSGRYCFCDRKYPDEEVECEDEMIQCVICEDWYHKGHLGVDVPLEYSDMTCNNCMKKHSFISKYLNLAAQPLLKMNKTDELESVDVENAKPPSTPSKPLKRTHNEMLHSNSCLIEGLISVLEVKTFFWKDGWRELLCRCSKCVSMYESEGLQFLLKTEDSITYYENKGKDIVNKRVSDETNKYLSNMTHSQQIELAHGIHELKAGIAEFMAEMHQNGNGLVTEENVHNFFEKLNQKKRARYEEGFGIPPDSCK